ncbi:MAG TPA: hypothetical protein VGU90_11345, partial [Terriglobales bacterium]|nr:hypothetical protein [Terriglobales bacterium]
RNLDDLLTDFMLFQLEYKKGDKTPQFNLLVDECGRSRIVWEKNVREWFKSVHTLRTRGLHRREREIADTQVAQITYDFYNVFQYFTDYFEAQKEKTVILGCKRYRRIRYGDKREWRELTEYRVRDIHPCHDCGVLKGALHLDGCDWEQCPHCKGQYLGCPCKFEEEEHVAKVVSSGVNQLFTTDATTA